MVHPMRGNEKMIFNKDLELKFGVMAAPFLETILTAKNMDMESIYGMMGRNTKDNGYSIKYKEKFFIHFRNHYL